MVPLEVAMRSKQAGLIHIDLGWIGETRAKVRCASYRSSQAPFPLRDPHCLFVLVKNFTTYPTQWILGRLTTCVQAKKGWHIAQLASAGHHTHGHSLRLDIEISYIQCILVLHLVASNSVVRFVHIHLILDS